jgi:hypothetical protein
MSTVDFLESLFQLHISYAKLENNEDGFFSASPAMRKYLNHTMIKVISDDCLIVLSDFDNDDYEKIARAHLVKERLIKAIDDPADVTLKLKAFIVNNQSYLLFNPNWMDMKQLSKLIKASKLDIKAKLLLSATS